MSDAPVVKPDLSSTSVSTAVATDAAAVAPFLSSKVRSLIYSVGGVAAVVAIATAPVVGGTVGEVLNVVGAGLTALSGGVALSHVSK